MNKKYLYVLYSNIENKSYASLIIEFEDAIHREGIGDVILHKPIIKKIRNIMSDIVTLSTLDGETLTIRFYDKTYKYNVADLTVTYNWYENNVFNSIEEAELKMECME